MTVFGRILLISGGTATGGADFLAERTQSRAVGAIRAEQPECQVTVTGAAGLGAGEIATLTSASLFSDASALVLTDLQDLPEQAQAELVDFAASPTPEVAVVLAHGGGAKGKGLLDKLRAKASVTEVKIEAPKYERDFAGWVRGELRDLGATIDDEAATFLVAAVGQDLRALAGAADQLAVSVENPPQAGGAPRIPITVEVVKRYFGGRADVRGYEIADAAIDGRIDVALAQARWAESAKVAAIPIISAFAAGLRQLAKLADAPRGMSDADLARHVGAPPFKIRILRRQLNAWESSGLARALEAVARTDRDVKSGEADATFAVERLVLQVAAARQR